MTYPYNDENMIYDYEEHRYILTEDCVLRELNIDLSQRLNTKGSASKQDLPKQILNEVSISIYSEIYASSNQDELKEYLCAKCPSARKILKDAMKQQLLYLLTSGEVARYSGVNTKTGKVIDPKYLRGAVTIDYKAERILLRQLKEYGGYNLMYAGTMPIAIGIVLDYEKAGY